MSGEEGEGRRGEIGYRWVLIVLSWFLYFSFGLIHSTLFVLVTPLMEDLSLTYSQMGVILGSWQLVYIFSAEPIGLLIDRFGIFKSLLVGSIIISVSAAFRWFTFNFESLLLSVALFGLGGPMISIGLPKLMSKFFIGDERGAATGVYASGNTVGSIAALSTTNSVVMPLLGSWRTVFLSYSVIGFSITGLWILVGHRFLHSHEARVISQASTGKGVRETMKVIFNRRSIWLIVIIGVISFLTSHGLTNWLPKILELKGMTANEAGAAVSSLQISGVLGSIMIPRLSSLLNSHKLAISLTLFALGIAVLLLGVTSGAMIWFAILLAGVMMRGLLPILMITLMDMPGVSSDHMGMIGGLYFSIGEIGGFGGPFIIGLLKDATSSFTSGIFFISLITEASIFLAALLETD